VLAASNRVDVLCGQEYQEQRFTDYKEGNKTLIRLIEFLEKFVPANKHLIEDHQRKLKLGKKTRRWKMSQ